MIASFVCNMNIKCLASCISLTVFSFLPFDCIVKEDKNQKIQYAENRYVCSPKKGTFVSRIYQRTVQCTHESLLYNLLPRESFSMHSQDDTVSQDDSVIYCLSRCYWCDRLELMRMVLSRVVDLWNLSNARYIQQMKKRCALIKWYDVNVMKKHLFWFIYTCGSLCKYHTFIFLVASLILRSGHFT